MAQMVTGEWKTPTFRSKRKKLLKRKCKDHAESLSAIPGNPGDKRAIAESNKASMAVNKIPPIHDSFT